MDNCLPQPLTSNTEFECLYMMHLYKSQETDYKSKHETFDANINMHKVRWQLTIDWSFSPFTKSDKYAIQPRICLKLVSADIEVVTFKWEVLTGESRLEMERLFSTGIVALKPGNVLCGFIPRVKRDELVIIVKITMMECSQPQTDIVTRESDISKLYNDVEFSDVTIIVGDSKFPVHKNILALRSDVFAAMLRHELEEKKTNQIVIDDFDSIVIREMLCYIYTGQSSKISQMAAELLKAADKYAVEDMKEACILELKSKLDIDTAVPTLIFADLHSAQQLKQYAIDFIQIYSVDIYKTEAFRDMIKTYPHIALDIIEAQHKYLTQIS